MIHDRTSGLKLMERANPLLFSQESYEEYPIEYDELKHYLANDGDEEPPHRNSSLYKNVDYLDFFLYKNDDNHASGIDLERKLVCEYALYQVQMQQRSGKLREGWPIALKEIIKLEPQSVEWYECLLVLLESINATKIDTSIFDTGITNMNSAKKVNERGLHRNNTSIRTNNSLQELTSCILSNAIKKGIELKPVNMDNPVEFLKNAIETILASSQPNSQISAHNAAEEDIILQKEELETAFKDLQLAHNFLTKQFEHDRAEYIQNIEQLQRTNKELQQKLLNYHSDLSQAESKLQEKERVYKQLEETSKRSSLRTKNYDLTSPIFSGEIWNAVSPGSAKSANSTANNSHSITIMRTEFKRMLTDTQRKYEKEIQEERESRIILEAELSSLRNKPHQSTE